MKTYIVCGVMLILGTALPAYPQMGQMGNMGSMRGYNGHELEQNLVLPQLVVGDSYSMTIALVNLGDPDRMGWLTQEQLQTKGKISFYRQDGTRLSVSVNGGAPVTELRFALEPARSAYFELAASGADVSGWALIEIDDDGGETWGRMDDDAMRRGHRVMATAFYTLKNAGQALSRVGVTPSLYEMNRYFSSLLAARQDADTWTGVAVVNTGATATLVTLRLKDTEGTVLATASLSLGAGSQTARFIHELFGGAVPERFQGTLELSTSGEGVVALGLLVSKGILTSIPTFHYGVMSRM